MDRRTLLISLMALAASQVACQQNAGQPLRIAALKDSFPPQVIAAFKKTLQGSDQVKISTHPSIAALFQLLQDWHQTEAEVTPDRSISLPFLGSTQEVAIADWVSLNDYWLAAAIQQNLIRPLPVDQVPTWAELPDRWRSLLQRDDQGFLSSQGNIWGTPYRWGTLVMVYDHRPFDRLGWQPTQWEDLWRPEIAGRIALPNHPRLTLGIVLKSLGYSANEATPKRRSDVSAALQALAPQVKLYASEDYVQPIVQGDIWLAIGWSTDVLPILSQYRQLRAVVPDPGTLLSADIWVTPRGTGPGAASELTELEGAWLAHWWQPETQAPLNLFSHGIAPGLLTPEFSSTALSLSPEKLLLPSPSQLAQSEFLTPLSPEAVDAYTALWQQLRGSK